MPDLNKLFRPESIAVIGASDDTTNLRGRFVRTLLRHPYAGRIHLVSRSSREVAGRPTYERITDIPNTVDLAILLVPAASVCDALEDCGSRGVPAAIVLASGFAEDGTAESRARQSRVRAIAERYDMAVSGPNSEGFADLDSGLAATFSPVVECLEPTQDPVADGAARVAVIAQSGAMGFAFLDAAAAKSAPLRHVITTGNEACVDLTRCLQYHLDEESAEVFVLFIEGLKAPRAFLQQAERALALGKPIIAVKIGRSEVSRRATRTHTGAMAGSFRAYRAAFERVGVIEAGDIDEAIDIAAAFCRHRHRLPRGRRIGILTASGGGGGWMADVCIDQGLEVPSLDATTRARLDGMLPSYGSSVNPVDVTAQALRAVGYGRFAEIVAESDSVDSVVVISSLRTAVLVRQEAEALQNLGRACSKPVVFWSYSQPIPEAAQIVTQAGLPLYTSLRNTARALAAMADYAFARDRALAGPNREGEPSPRIPASALDALPRCIPEYQAKALLRQCGIPVPPSHLATTADEAAAAVAALECATAMKIQSAEIPHKSDVGGVHLGITTSEDARDAFDRLIAAAQRHGPRGRVDGVLIEPMAPEGHEIVLGVSRDESFGPIVMVGWGGTYAEVVKDIAFALAPVDREEARALLRRLKVWSVLAGTRGQRPADVGALVDVIVRVSLLAVEHAETIAELDLNPVIVHSEGQGVSIVDALIVRADGTG